MIEIPTHYIELERIYAATFSRERRAVAVVSTYPGEGVSSVVMALAKRNIQAGRSTLVVDFNLHSPLLSTQAQARAPRFNRLKLSVPTYSAKQLVHAPINFKSCTSIIPVADKLSILAGPATREAMLRMREPEMLRSKVKQWLKQFDVVIFDTSPVSLNNGGNLPPELVASACDGAILTVLAGQTTTTALSNTLNKLQSAEVLLLGSVINDQYNPTLRDELVRKLNFIGKISPWLARKLKDKIMRNNLLALEI
ncbi:protein SypD [Alteromonadales bacterium alter-6D02]|nr:protein SypD [Alteromonadales bacterium alter-6D02]